MARSSPLADRFRHTVESGDAEGLRALATEAPEVRGMLDEPWFAFEAPALVHAAGRGQRELIDILVELGADLDARSVWDAGPYSALHRCVDGGTPESLRLAEHLLRLGATLDLHTAAGLGRLDRIVELLDADPSRVSEPGPDGATPLHLARNAATAELLLDRGAEVEKRCVDHNSTPAMWAMDGRDDVVRLLLDRGAKPDLFMAAGLDDVSMARAVIDREPEAIRARVRFGESCEHLGGGDKYVWALDFAETPLEVARRRAHQEVYEFLLAQAPPLAKLVQASRRGDIEEIDRLLQSEPGLLAGAEGDDAVDMLTGEESAVAHLLAHGADPNARDDRNGATALHDCAWHGHREKADILLKAGADSRIRDRTHQSTPLGWADYGGRREFVDHLVETGEVDLTDACWLGLDDRVRSILENDPSRADGPPGLEGGPIRCAAWYGRAEVVRMLLEAGANPSIPHPESGKAALDHAIEQGHTDVVEALNRTG